MRNVVALILLTILGWAHPVQSLGIADDKPGRLIPPAITVLESGPTGERSVVAASWRTSLESEITALGTSFTVLDLVEATTGGIDMASRTFSLPSLQAPVVQVLSSDFESANLSGLSAGTLSQLADMLPARAVQVVDIGLMQREPVGTLEARMLTFDPASHELRRYRRLTIQTNHAPIRRSQLAKRSGIAGGSSHLAVTRSVLADGSWFKIPVTEDGIYRIDADYLAALGLAPQGVDPARIRIFGNGGKPLPALNGDPRPVDLVEQPIFVSHDNDTAFEPGEYALFYGVGPRGWKYDATERDWTHYVNSFSNENYYFIEVGGPPGLRLEQGEFPNYADATPLDEFEARMLVDDDLIQLEQDGSGSGLEWFGAFVDSEVPSRTVVSAKPDGIQSGTIRYRSRVIVRSNPAASLQYLSGGTVLATATPGLVDLGSQTGYIAKDALIDFSEPVPTSGDISLDLRLLGSANDPQGWLDWIEIYYPRSLAATGGYLRFHTPVGEDGRYEFHLTGFSGQPLVWDVTTLGQTSMLAVQQSGSEWIVQVDVPPGSPPRELLAFNTSGASIRTPDPGESIPNQNLHGIESYPEFAIVTAADMLPVAQELAAMRQAEGMSVVVVDIQKIYNEFSGGVPDMRAMRDYFKFLYDRGLNEGSPFLYALLLGDGHFDFRGITEDENSPLNRNVIFPYQTDNTLHKGSSYTSDDYFGLLDDNEGIWKWTSDGGGTFERVDIGIGRWPVESVDEARAVLEKVKRYESPASQGAWRTRYTFVADDGPAGSRNDKDLHTQNADVVAEALEGQFPEVNTTKIYAISYPTVTTSNGRRIPDAKRDILTTLNDGTLVWNYSGHGGISGLADERIFTLEDIDQLANDDRMSVFITATCTFGRFDTDREKSGAELLLLKEQGGSVALFTTVRIVVTSSNPSTYNLALNLELNKHLMQRDEEGRGPRLGDALRITKNTSAGLQGNSRKFNLLGDPTMRLGLPNRDVSVVKVNGELVSDTTSIALKALDRVVLDGEVSTSVGRDPSFEGTVEVTVFDAKRKVEIDPDKQQYIRSGSYTIQNDLIYRGQVRVVDGVFQVTFVVPKDISFSELPGRISMYASSEGGDGFGATEHVDVGGTADNPVVDNEGPVIELFLNDSTFVSGGLTPPEPLLLVKFRDETGINTVGTGVGHEMLLVIDEDEQDALEIGDRFEAALGSFQSGSLTYRLPEQTIGTHTLRVRAWDVANNSSTSVLDYVVAPTEALVLQNVFNYPNPMVGSTRFVFEHNQPAGTPAQVELRLYSISGRLLNILDESETLPSGMLPGGPVQIPWDGRDADLDVVSPGVYLYQLKVTVDLPSGEQDSVEHIGRLAVLG
ncbi:MAG: type IX secretion system sortase PorU [Rhodothermales bacterium]